MKVKILAKAFVGSELLEKVQVGFLYKSEDNWVYHGIIPFVGHPVWEQLEKRKIKGKEKV